MFISTDDMAEEAAGRPVVHDAEASSEKLMPQWSPLLDQVMVATQPVTDVVAFLTKHPHAPAPHSRFNALIRADLRQTPSEFFGKPFQSYIFLCAFANSPSAVFISRQLRVLRAFHAAYSASLEKPAAEGEDGAEPAWQRPAVLDRLLEMAETLDRVLSGASGRLFLLECADFLEDVCAYVFLSWVWPRLHSMQRMHQQHERRERVISEKERMDMAEWSVVIRKILPLLLSTLESVMSVDAMTLGGAAYGLCKLFLREKDSHTGQAELGRAIARLEQDLGEASSQERLVAGEQVSVEHTVATAVSFDPQGVRPPNFAFFAGERARDSPHDQNPDPAAERPPHSTIVMPGHQRLQQDRLCLLTCLYERWIDVSLRTHLRNPTAQVKRARHPNASADEEDALDAAAAEGSTKIALSNPEAAVLSRCGENPYLRCLFFVAVAKRRPDVAATALGKACQEAEKAAEQEQLLWEFQEHELGRQQHGLRHGPAFGSEFKGKALRGPKKPKAHSPLVCGRAPGTIRLRLPPLIATAMPAVLPCSVELDPAAQAYDEKQHSQKLAHARPGATLLTCVVYGKTAGTTGTSVSEMHKDLLGTGLRQKGYQLVEISGLKPNTNYSFASMYYEGFEPSRPAASSISDSSPPIGSYYPLPLALLRVEICRTALEKGEACSAAWSRAWRPLFETFCERTSPAEEFDSYGLRTCKLRPDVADRFPPMVLAAFAELVLQRNGHYGKKLGGAPPATKARQVAALRGANECLVAVDCARRAGSSYVTLQAISLCLRLVGSLLRYRTRPHMLLSLLARCAAALESFEPSEEETGWYAEARLMAMYLVHHITVMCVQLRQPELLPKTLEVDAASRYKPHALADPAAQVATNQLLLDQALELALLGGVSWQHAEQKIRVVLQDHVSVEDLARLLKELSERAYGKVAADAAQLALKDDESRHPFSLALMRIAITRTWESDDSTQAPLVEVLKEARAELFISTLK